MGFPVTLLARHASRYALALWLACALICGAAGATEPSPMDPVARLARILELIRSRYVDPVDEARLLAEAVKAIMKGLDTHSVYLDPEAYRRLLHETQGKYGGLGIEVRKEGDVLRVVSVFEDTPAARAGLLAEDVISAVNEHQFVGMTLEQSVRLVRGEPNTALMLTLNREGEPGLRRLALDREQIQGRSVRGGMIGERYAYVRLTEFNRYTAEEMVLKLERMAQVAPHGIHGVILDLRDNPGGTLNSAVAVASAFLPPDALVVYTQGMAPESKLKFLARKEDYLRGDTEDYLERMPPDAKRAPLAVLVNRGSASSAEIVAGALQDHARATVVGTRTYGKGSIQVILPIGDGSALKLTTSRYYTPKGRVIEKNGLTPDRLVEQAPVEGPDAVSHFVALGRLSDWSIDQPADAQLRCAPAVTETPAGAPRYEALPDSTRHSDIVDCQLAFALEILERQAIAHGQ